MFLVKCDKKFTNTIRKTNYTEKSSMKVDGKKTYTKKLDAHA